MKISLLNIARKVKETPINQIARKIARGYWHYIKNYPTLVILQTVSACNLQCRHCFINNYGKEIEKGLIRIMGLEEFAKMIQRISNVIKRAEYFQFSTFEPTLNKHIFEMMDILLQINPKIRFPILTNGMMINEDYIVKLSNYPISEFTVSLDGYKKETVESFKTGAIFEKIIDTLKLANRYSFKVNTVFVLHKNNFTELPNYMDFVKELGVKTVFVNNILSFAREFEDWHLYSKKGNPEVERILELAKEKARKNRQTLYLPLLKPEKLGCTACESLFININGDVSPCDFLAVDTPFLYEGEIKQNPPLIFGNVWKNEPYKIYNSEGFKKFRNMHRNKEIPEVCSHCIDAYGLFCSNRKSFGAN